MITTLEEARHEVQVAVDEYCMDQDVEASDDMYTDMLVAIAWQIEDLEVARELCMTEIGWIPFDLQARLG